MLFFVILEQTLYTFFSFWSSHKVVRVNDLIFFPSSLANWLLQGGLNWPAWLFYQNTAFPGLFYLDFKGGGGARGFCRGQEATLGLSSLPAHCAAIPCQKPCSSHSFGNAAGRQHKRIWPSGVRNAPLPWRCCWVLGRRRSREQR